MKNIFPQTLPAKTNELVKLFQRNRPVFLKSFYLSGGTALSLQLNHRESKDLDFFSPKDFDPNILMAELIKIGKLKGVKTEKNTLNGFLNKTEIQFLGYPYPLLKPVINWEGIQISSIIDIACTKLQTIGARGNKKDFIDLYFILKIYSLEYIFKMLDKKYRGIDFNKTHILKSLVYFADANSQPMPKMRQKASWEEVQKIIVKSVSDAKSHRLSL